MACRAPWWVSLSSRILGEASQTDPGAVMPAVVLPGEESGALELLEHAVQGRLGDARLFDEPLQGEQLVLGRDHLEQCEQAQRRGVSG